MIEQQLANIIEDLNPRLIAFCQKLMQTPSVNAVYPERALAEVIAAEAISLGLQAKIVGDDPERPNVVVSMPNATIETQTGLLLVGHLDTVPEGDAALWKHPPFEAVIDDGRIYGRGAVDTKGGMAAAIYALGALAKVEGALPNKQAQMIGVPDEETGATGTLGIKYLQREGLLQGSGAIYTYSGNQITLGHRGLIRYKLMCHGESVHTGLDEWQDGVAGANAVTGLARLIVALEDQRFAHSKIPYFDRYRPLITPGTVIEGGTSVNIVPNYSEALVDIRTTPEFGLSQMQTLLDTLIAEIEGTKPKLRFEYEMINHLPAVISDEQAAIFPILRDAATEVRGETPPYVVAGPANEGYLLIEAGIPTVCGFGPIGENAHAIDEYVEVNSLAQTALIFALTAHRLS